MSLSSYSLWSNLLLALFAGAWLIQMILLFMVYIKPLMHSIAARKNRLTYNEEQPGVSVVIYAHNQAEHLMRNLPILMESEYADYEVIVVNDASTDETEDVLTVMEQRYDRLYHTKINDEVRTVSRCKLAILLGVKAARFDYILTTHANCVPATPHWMEQMVRNFTDKTDIVLGPICYSERVGLISRFCAYDFFFRMVRLMGITLGVKSYAGWGMNLAFRKSTFFANRGFSHHLNIHPGEDDLFVADVARRGNTRVECGKSAMVTIKEAQIRYDWGHQRFTQAYTSRFYALMPRLVMALDRVTIYLTFVSAIASLIIFWGHWTLFGIVAGLFLLRYVADICVLYFTAGYMGIHRPFLASPVAELVIPIVDLHYKIKAALNKKNFIVGRV